ncbi:hypothetical protein K504DRAFT_461995 [Pleomassaria siparia CBS 279.74]|uniref:Carbohydrate esterase family 16 protein n=1 Tax=Pleomassaria siparia CBS 279.74 TaxID=1314801 RepID=A0A6G1KLP1_9PLEO|nr:hypothetical protein K504DRAFT_461995 [Pleomassaria siparia CBS 279.74]
MMAMLPMTLLLSLFTLVSANPVRQHHLPRNYAALGDSFSAGVGSGQFLNKSRDGLDFQCIRQSGAYPLQLQRIIPFTNQGPNFEFTLSVFHPKPQAYVPLVAQFAYKILVDSSYERNVYIGPTNHCRTHHWNSWRNDGCAGYEVPDKCAMVLHKDQAPIVVCENGDSFKANRAY